MLSIYYREKFARMENAFVISDSVVTQVVTVKLVNVAFQANAYNRVQDLRHRTTAVMILNAIKDFAGRSAGTAM